MKLSASNTAYKPIGYTPSSGAPKVAFKGKAEILKDLSKRINQENDWVARSLTKLGKVNKESLSTVITAIGTAFVAPIFIAFNPISKEDKETKIYSAMRQPISAVIALAVQLGVNKQFNNFLDKLASTGGIDRANLTASPTDSYLKNKIKKQQPNLSKVELEKAVKKAKNEAFWNAVAEARQTKKFDKIEFKDLVDTEFFNDAKDQLKAEKADLLKGKSKKQQAQILDSDTIMARALKNVEDAMNFSAEVKLETSKLKSSGMPFADAIEKITSEVKSLDDELKTITDAAQKELKTKQKTIKEAALKKLSNYDNFDQIKVHGSTIEEVLQSVKIKQLIEAQTSVGKKVLASGKTWGGIGIALLTLPFSCGLLNWAYPRIMEKFFPEIANAKKAKGGK